MELSLSALSSHKFHVVFKTRVIGGLWATRPWYTRQGKKVRAKSVTYGLTNTQTARSSLLDVKIRNKHIWILRRIPEVRFQSFPKIHPFLRVQVSLTTILFDKFMMISFFFTKPNENWFYLYSKD